MIPKYNILQQPDNVISDQCQKLNMIQEDILLTTPDVMDNLTLKYKAEDKINEMNYNNYEINLKAKSKLENYKNQPDLLPKRLNFDYPDQCV